MSKLMVCFAFTALLSLFSSPANTQSAELPGCAVDSSVVTCVTSAAVTFGGLMGPGHSTAGATVSVTMRVTNTTDYPVGVAINYRAFAFTPQNSATIEWNGYGPNFTGLQTCSNGDDCEFTTIAPGKIAIVQVAYEGRFDATGLQLMQIARTASFTGSLFVNDRGATRIVSLALDGFMFGNGLSRGN